MESPIWILIFNYLRSLHYSVHQFSQVIYPCFFVELECSLIERTSFWFTVSSLRVGSGNSSVYSVDGVFTTIDDVHATYVLGKDENGEDITISNLKVIKLLQSLWSRGYVNKTYSWWEYDSWLSVGAISTTPWLILVSSLSVSSSTFLTTLSPTPTEEWTPLFLVRRDPASTVMVTSLVSVVMVSVVSTATTAAVLTRSSLRRTKFFNDHAR